MSTMTESYTRRQIAKAFEDARGESLNGATMCRTTKTLNLKQSGTKIPKGTIGLKINEGTEVCSVVFGGRTVAVAIKPDAIEDATAGVVHVHTAVGTSCSMENYNVVNAIETVDSYVPSWLPKGVDEEQAIGKAMRGVKNDDPAGCIVVWIDDTFTSLTAFDSGKKQHYHWDIYNGEEKGE